MIFAFKRAGALASAAIIAAGAFATIAAGANAQDPAEAQSPEVSENSPAASAQAQAAAIDAEVTSHNRGEDKHHHQGDNFCANSNSGEPVHVCLKVEIDSTRTVRGLLAERYCWSASVIYLQARRQKDQR